MNATTYTTNTNRTLYRSRNGVVFGVCRGLAEYSELPVLGIRLVVVILSLFAFPFVPIAYVIAAVMLKPAPVLPFSDDDEQEFYNSYASDRKLALSRLKRRMESLERRTRRMESSVTNREEDWERRFKQT